MNKRQMELREHLEKINSFKNSRGLLENFIDKVNLGVAFSDLSKTEVDEVFNDFFKEGMDFNTKGDKKRVINVLKKNELDNEERAGTKKMKDSSGKTFYMNADGEREYDEDDVIDDEVRNAKLAEAIFNDFFNENEILNEAKEKEPIEVRRWKFAVYCIKFLKNASLDEIIKAKYPEDPEKLQLKRKEKIALVREIANQAFDETHREDFINENLRIFTKLNKMNSVGKEAGKTGVGTVGAAAVCGGAGLGIGYLAGQNMIAGAEGFGKVAVALVAAIITVAGAIGGAILGAILAAGIGTGIAVGKNLKRKKELATLTKDEIEKELEKDNIAEKTEQLTEAVTFVDNNGAVKTTTAVEYNKSMHEYDTKTQIPLFKKLKRKDYKLGE